MKGLTFISRLGAKLGVSVSLIILPVLHINAAPKTGLNIGNDTTICTGSCLTLISNITGTYRWSTGATTSSITVCPGYNTTITLKVTAGSSVYNDTINITVDKYCVWPGDANEDGVVDKRDVLNIGFAYGKTGPSRANASSSWTAQHADNWKGSFKHGNLNYKYNDCNGDGKIDSNDLAAIHANWSNVHKKTMDTIAGVSGIPQLYMVTSSDTVSPGEMLTFHIFLGTLTDQVSDVYGVAFSYQFSPGTVQPGSMQLDVNQSNCWLYGTDGPGAIIPFLQPDYDNEIANVVITRTASPGISGYGQIGDLDVFIPDNVGGKKSLFGPKRFNFSDEEVIDDNESDIALGTSGKTVFLVNSTLGIKAAILMNDNIDIYPNPVAGNVLNINMRNLKAESMTITDLLGNTVYNSVQPLSGTVQVQLPQLNQGIYVVRISTENGNIVRKINIIN